MVIRDSDIELILQRINISYAEAEKALIKTKGDINKALRYLHKKQDSTVRKTFNKTRNRLVGIFKYKLIITRNNEILINLPIMLILIFLMVFNNFGLGFGEFLLLLLLIILTDCKVTIEKKGSHQSTESKSTVPPVNKTEIKDDIITTLDVIEEDDYNEILVEN